MFRARLTPLAESSARVHHRAPLSVLVLTILVTSTAFAAALCPHPAGADPITDLQAKATAISQELVQQQLEVDTDQQQYSVVSARVAADNQAIVQIGQQITRDQAETAARTGAVRQQAIQSYMDYGTGSTTDDGALFGGGQERTQEASEYASIAVGNITTTVDQLRSAQAALQVHQAVLRRQQEQDRSDQEAQATDLSQADTSAAQLAALHSQVTGQLATAVADQAAAQDAAAAAAVAAAQHKATASSDRSSAGGSQSTTGPSGGSTTPAPVAPPAPGAGLPDPALNGFLQCVIQRESGGDYSINTGNGYYGAFQFSQSTWNFAAQAAGLSYLVGVLPSSATKAEQDTVAVALYALDGGRPWTGDCGA